MKRIGWMPKIVLLFVLLGLASGSSSAYLPPGRLVVASTPQGATILIDGRTMKQKTNATFIVSAGMHRVLIINGAGGANCAARIVLVNPNETSTIQCP